MAGKGSKEFCSKEDGVGGLAEQQGLQEVSQQCKELRMLLNVGAVGRSQLLL